MTDREAVALWMQRYLTAWSDNGPADLAAAFTDDVEYRFKPHEEPARGLPALTERWLAGRDEPGDFRFAWTIVAIEDDTAVVRGRTDYVAGPVAGSSYENLWVVTLAPDGRASAFTEWWMQVGA